MESSTEPGMPLPNYCSVATTLEAPPWDLSFTCPSVLRAPLHTWHTPFTRCACYHPCLHIADPAWQGPGWLGRVGDAADTWVLARREPDGFYYWTQIKAAPELERQGAVLVGYDAPLVTGPELPAPRQSVVLGDTAIQFSPFMGYSLRPGDKVLAAWEPDQQRYGPATVLRLDARASQKVSKEEEITVHFWNGKIASVPLGEVRPVPPAMWKKAVEGLHNPFAREHSSPFLWASCSSLPGPVTGCVTYGLPVATPLLCPPCHPNVGCQLLCQGGLCCCLLARPTWWPLTRISGVVAREHAEMELKPTAQLLPLEGPKEEEEVATQAPMAVIASSSSSEEEDLETDLEKGFPQKLMVDSTVNTDPILLEKSLRRQRGLCRPKWWRKGPEPHPGKSGLETSCCNIQKEEKGNKHQRQQTVEVGDTKELALEATNMKPLQILPEEAEHRTLSPSTTSHQRDQNSS